MRAVARALIALLGSWIIAAGASAQSGFDSNGQCVGDANGDGEVDITEVILAVNNALNSCGFVPITLQFRAAVGEETFSCGNVYHNVGTTNADIVPSDFRFYIYNVRLVTKSGQVVPMKLDQDHAWQLDNIALLDFENRVPPCGNGTTATNTVVHGMVPPGNYTGVRFQLGLPFDRNHGNQAIAPSPLDLTGMFWSWQAGYRFLKIDTAFDNVRVHLGSTGCLTGSNPTIVTGCARMNIPEVEFDGFDPASNFIVADLAALLKDNDIDANQPNTPPGCESDPQDQDCAPMFTNLGLHFSDGTPSPATQKFFRVE
jgi:uncharacterized repeat protein (TIGR04052 family)